MNAIVERFFPEALRNADFDTQRRARLILHLAFICAIASGGYVPVYLAFSNSPAAIAASIASVIFLLTAFVFRSTGSISLVGHSLCATALAIIGIGDVTTGALYSPAAVWFVLVFLLAVLTMGNRQGRIWLVIVLMVAGVLSVLEINGTALPNFLAPDKRVWLWTISLISFSLIIFAIISVFESGKQQLLLLLHQEQDSIKGKVREAREELQREQAIAHAKDQKMLATAQEQQHYLESSVSQILQGVEQFSQGNLTVRLQSLDAAKRDEIARLTDGLNEAIANVRDLMRKVRETADSTAQSSNEILSATEKMAFTAAEQARKASAVTERITELTEQMQRGASSARGFANMAQGTVKSSQDGSQRIQEAITGMGSIAFVVAQSAETIRTLGESSNQIGEIVQVINEIADQTNLLALNAAIEAARAGDQGRGFAVVADEVRKLAERTTKATKEIATMIKRIQNDTQQAVVIIGRGTGEVERGTRLVEEAGEAFMITRDNAAKGAEAYESIASGIETRATAFNSVVETVKSTVGSMESTVEMTHHIEHSLESLSGLVRDLQALLRQFAIDDAQGAHIHSPMLQNNTQRFLA
jgi:methyl-accepting chemotaxis protein